VAGVVGELSLSWNVVAPHTFKSLYKKKSSHEQGKINKIIRDLMSSPNPRVMCEKKHGPLGECYSIDLSRSSRIVLAFVDDKKEIRLLRVCSHKETYTI